MVLFTLLLCFVLHRYILDYDYRIKFRQLINTNLSLHVTLVTMGKYGGILKYLQCVFKYPHDSLT